MADTSSTRQPAVKTPRETPRVKIQLWFPRLLLAAAVLFFLYQMVAPLRLFGDHAIRSAGFPYSLDYGEGPILDQVARLSRFENIYQPDLSQFPYTVTNYPPLYPLVQVPFYWLFGPSFLYGRVISLLSVLAAAVFIGLALYNMTRNPVAAAAGGLTLLALPYVLHWSPLTRVDSLALGLSWAGLFVLTKWEDKPKGIAIAALLMVAAIYTRQSYGLAAPLAGFVWLLRQAPRKRALVFTAWVAGAGLALFLLLTLLSSGGFFTHIVTANVNPFLWETVQRYRTELFDHLPLLFILAFTFLLAGWIGRNRAWFLAAPYLVGGILSAITIGKDGSNVNYLYELCAALSLTVGAVLAWPGRRTLGTAFLLALLALQVGGLSDWTERDYYSRNINMMRYENELRSLLNMTRNAQAPVLADEYMSMLPLVGEPIVYQPFEYKMLTEGGLWDDEPFLQSLRDKEYAYIFLYDPRFWDSRHARWTQEMLDTIEANYKRTYRLGETSVYAPK